MYQIGNVYKRKDPYETLENPILTSRDLEIDATRQNTTTFSFSIIAISCGMQSQTPLKRPLNERNQNIVFTPFTPGQLNPPSPKRRYSKKSRLVFDTPTPSLHTCTPSRPDSHPSRLEETLTDCEPDEYGPLPAPSDYRQHQPTFTNTVDSDTQDSAFFFNNNEPSDSDNILRNVNNYLQSCNWSLWRFLEALLSSRDQQISSSVSRLLLSHGGELLDAVKKKKPDIVKNWARQQLSHDLEREGAKIVSALLPPYGDSISDLLSNFSLSAIALRTKACAPLLWECLSSVGIVHEYHIGRQPQSRRNEELVSGFFFFSFSLSNVSHRCL